MNKINPKLDKIDWLTNEVLHVKFSTAHPFGFEAGQFMMFEFEHQGKQIKKAFSIANAPDDHLEFLIKYFLDGATGNNLTRKDCDSVEMTGPYGKMTAPSFDPNLEPHGIPLIFLATGVGIAPFWSIITDQLENKKNILPIHLYFGARKEESLFFVNELEELAKKFPNFSYTISLTQPSENWKGKTGRITELLKNNPLPKGITHFFICGSPEMVKDTKQILLQKGAQPKQIHFEVW